VRERNYTIGVMPVHPAADEAWTCSGTDPGLTIADLLQVATTTNNQE
jgi:hypothetical protein